MKRNDYISWDEYFMGISLLAVHFQSDENYASRVTTYVMQLQKDGFIKLGIGN